MKRYIRWLARLLAKVNANILRIVLPIAIQMPKSELAKDSKPDTVKYIICSGANLQQGVTEYLQKRFRNVPVF